MDFGEKCGMVENKRRWEESLEKFLEIFLILHNSRKEENLIFDEFEDGKVKKMYI